MPVPESPVEKVLSNGNINEIETMLNIRWQDGWELHKIIDHTIRHSDSPGVILYYFKKRNN